MNFYLLFLPFYLKYHHLHLFSRGRFHTYPLLSCPMQFIARLLSAHEVTLKSSAIRGLAALPGADGVNNCTVTMQNCLILVYQCFPESSKESNLFSD